MHRTNTTGPVSLLATLALLVTACATVPPVNPLSEVQTVEVSLFVTPTFDPQVPVQRDPQYHVGRNAGGGAAAGAMAGLECGPFVIICAPMGAMVGAVGGAIYGAAAGAATSLPTDDAETFNALSSNHLRSRDLGGDLKRAAQLAVIAHQKLLEPNNPDATLSLNLTALQWTIGVGNTVQLSGTLKVSVNWPGGFAVRTYEQRSARINVDDWIADDGALVGHELDALIDALVKEMVEDLQGLTATGSTV